MIHNCTIIISIIVMMTTTTIIIIIMTTTIIVDVTSYFIEGSKCDLKPIFHEISLHLPSKVYPSKLEFEGEIIRLGIDIG